MRCAGAVALGLLLSQFVFSQTPPPADQTQQPPSYANYSLMLVSPVLGGGAVALMHNPKNELEFVDINRTKDAFAAGYVPVRAIELGELIAALKEENARLTAENARLQNAQPQQSAMPAPMTPEQFDAEQRARIAAEQQAKRQQMIQTWLLLQNMNRPQPYVLPMPVNPNANRTNCTSVRIGDTVTTNCN